MKKTKTFTFVKLLLILTLVLLAFPFAACGEETVEPETGESKTAEYYYAADEGEYTVSLNGTAYKVQIAGESIEGTFNLQGESIVFNSFEAVNATIKGDELAFTYDGKKYVFLEKINYTVTFDLDGGTGVNNATVVNGKTAAKPAIDPVKEGKYVFIDWYTSKDYDKLYDFDTPVRGNVTVYAKFITNESENVFTVELYDAGELVGTYETVNGVLYKLPELTKAGETFLGWWVSQYDNAEKLSYKYTNQQIGANTQLYAVWADDDAIAVSVDAEDNKITWTSAGVNIKYTVTVTEPDGNEVNLTSQVTYVNYTPTQAGDYVVKVTAGEKTGTAYYRNKGLDKVTLFTVEGNVLKFNSIEGAEGYYLTIVCHNEAHDHSEKIDLGTKTEYDFTTCGMTEEGLTFTVEAYAKGYDGAVSAPYVVLRNLDAVNNITIDNEGDSATWAAVENAEYYIVTVKVGTEVKTFEVTETVFDLKEYSGNVTVTVVPVARCYNSPEAATANFEKAKLATPADFKFANGKFTWTKVQGATGYVVKIGDKEFATTANEFTLTEEDYAATGYAALAAVKAVGGAMIKDSGYSDNVNIGEGALADSFGYANGKFIWGSVFGATGYSLKIEGEEVVTDAKVNEYEFTLEKATTAAAVKYFRGENQSEWVEVTIKANKVTYDLGTGKEADNVIEYVVVGDALTLNDVTRFGYDFNGWYLDDQKIYAGTVLKTEGDVTVYAKWTARSYVVTMDPDKTGTLDKTTFTVTYGEMYKLPVPTSNNKVKVFAGWYTETMGAGLCYTSYDGTSLAKWNDNYNVKLYAKWVDIFKFDLITGGKAYSVSQGDGIDYVSTITIPATYEGLPVTAVEGSAFENCSTLVEINIPDSVTNIEVGIEGGYTGGSAFNGCRNLLTVNVYPVADVTNPKFISYDGILYEFNDDGGLSLKYYPKYREGAYVMPDNVTEIPLKALYQKTYLTELVIPASVKKIGANAFQGCSKLTKIIFEDAGANAAAIELGKDLFKSCSALVEISLPSNIETITATMFDGCTKLEKIEVNNNPNYVTMDGVLCEINAVSGQANKIIYYPKAKAGEYTVPTGITTIGEAAFKDCEALTKVTIPGGVTMIEKQAFYSCGALLEVEFTGKYYDGDLTIETEAFYSCSKITAITLPANLKTLKAYAFGGWSGLKTVTANCERETLDFEVYAFHYNNQYKYGYIEHLILGKKMAVVDINGVFGSSKLVDVQVDPENPYYTSQDGVLFDKAMLNLVYFPGAITGEYTIPETVTTIGTRVFQSKEITGIVIGKNVVSIGDQAFNSCKKLVKVTFEEGGTEPLVLGDEVFYLCSALPEIKLPERLTVLGDGVFKNCALLETVFIPKNVSAISETEMKEYVTDESSQVTILRTHVFDYCNSLTTITVDPDNAYYASVDGILYGKNDKGVINRLMVCPIKKGGTVDIVSTVEEIADKAFYNNALVTEIKFSNGLTSGTLEFGRNVFGSCKLLSKVELPQGLETIAAGVFYGCVSLEEVFIPKTVTLIESNAFNKCTVLKKVVFENGYIYKDEVNETTGETTTVIANYLTIGDGKYTSDYYGNYTYSGAFANTVNLTEVVLPERLIELGVATFSNGTGIEKVVLPANLESVSERAFYGCTKLSEIVFSEAGKLKSIESNAFYKTAVEKLELPEGLEVLGYYSFAYNTALKEVYFPKSIKTTESVMSSSSSTKYGYGFYNCTNLEKVVFPEGCQLEAIGSCLFYGCEKLDNIVIPKGVKTIDISAFRKMNSLTTIAFEEGSEIESIANYVFADNPKLTSIVIPKSIKTVGTYVFQNDTDLSSIVFEEESNLTSIGNYAFQSTAITSFRFPKSTSDNGISLGNYLFAKCLDLKHVSLSSSVTNFDGAFGKCSSIETIAIDADSAHFKTSEGNTRFILNRSGTAVRYVLGVMPESELVIPEGVTEISPNAFEGQVNLKKITVPSSIKVIGKRAFANCANLEEIVFADGAAPTFGDAVFSGCVSLKEIELPNSITYISNYMFDGCISLEKITLPAGVKMIGNTASASCYSFRNCRNLTSVTLTDNLTSIGGYAFYNTGLTSIVVPGNVTKINNYAFAGCKDLTSVAIANGKKITTLGSYLFQDCVSLESVDLSALSGVKTLPAGIFLNCENLSDVKLSSVLTSFGTKAFNGCKALKTLTVPANLTNFGTYCFQNSGLTSITIPATVKVLGTTDTAATTTSSSYIFEGCKDLETVVMPTTLTKIGGYVFRGCEKLKDIDLSHVVLIGSEAFKGCTSLTSVNLTGLQKSGSCGSWIFEGCTSLTDVTFKNVPTALGVGMFKDCTALEEITLPTTLTAIPARILQNTAISKIVIPASVTNLGNYTNYESTSAGYCFGYCTNLTEVVFAGTKCEGIGYGTFRGCTNLTEFKMPDSVGRIRGMAFAESGITEIKINAKTYELGMGVFAKCNLKKITVDSDNTKFVAEGNILYNLDKTEIYYHPDKAVSIDYETIVGTNGAMYGNNNAMEIVIPEGVTEIPDNMFYGFSGLTKITLPSTLTEIGEYSFYGCTGLKEIVFPDSLTVIGKYAFYGSGLESVTLGENIATVGTYAFASSALKHVTLDYVKEATIGTNQYGTVSITNPRGLNTNIFADCDSLTDVTFGEHVNYIAQYMFFGCDALKTINLPANLMKIDSYAFQKSGLETITVPESIEYIGTYAFSNCHNLTYVKIEGAMNKLSTSSGSYAFEYCDNLVTVDMPNYAAKTITAGWFRNCTKLEKVNYNIDNVTRIYANVFDYCTSMKEIRISLDSLVGMNMSFTGWTSDQTIRFIGNARDFAALELDYAWYNGCNAKIVFGDDAE